LHKQRQTVESRKSVYYHCVELFGRMIGAGSTTLTGAKDLKAVGEKPLGLVV